jgi:hypothetical protein
VPNLSTLFVFLLAFSKHVQVLTRAIGHRHLVLGRHVAVARPVGERRCALRQRRFGRSFPLDIGFGTVVDSLRLLICRLVGIEEEGNFVVTFCVEP